MTKLPPVQKLIAPSTVPTAEITGAGKALTVTTIALLNAEIQLFAFLTCTVYDPDVVAVMASVVAPLLQRYDNPVLEVKTTLSPEQKVISPLAVFVGVAGKALTVTVT